MIRTREDYAYAARVWMNRALTEELEREALARIEALLPSGYRYQIGQGEARDTYGTVHRGWTASFGDTADGSGWGVPHAYGSRIGATLGLLSILADGCVFPGCATAFGQSQAMERVRQEHAEILAVADRNGGVH
jgi:hypothetical protein